MKLVVHIDKSYLSKPNSKSRKYGHFFLSNKVTIPQKNVGILSITQIIRHVMTSATEAELEALYIMAHKAVYIRIV